jgi:PEGA domain-containing protein/putative oligomerization/nucleic acid binding protein
MTRPALGSLLGMTALVCGCGEAVWIRSGPSGAAVYVDERAVGTTPVRYALARSELDNPHHVRIEKDGYQPVTTSLHTRVRGGRVTGAVFTLGILAIFRSMEAFDPVFAQLQPLTPPQSDRDRILGEALRNLREQYDAGMISDQEFEHRQQELLRVR